MPYKIEKKTKLKTADRIVKNKKKVRVGLAYRGFGTSGLPNFFFFIKNNFGFIVVGEDDQL